MWGTKHAIFFIRLLSIPKVLLRGLSIQTPLKVLLLDNGIDTTIFKLEKNATTFVLQFKLCSLTFEKIGYRQFKIQRASTFKRKLCLLWTTFKIQSMYACMCRIFLLRFRTHNVQFNILTINNVKSKSKSSMQKHI